MAEALRNNLGFGAKIPADQTDHVTVGSFGLHSCGVVMAIGQSPQGQLYCDAY
jgi:hypothetical protein